MHKHPAIFLAFLFCVYSYGREIHIQNERPSAVGMSPQMTEFVRTGLSFGQHPRSLNSGYIPAAMERFESDKRLLEAEGIPYSIHKATGPNGPDSDTVLEIECDWTDGGDAATLGGPPTVPHGLMCIMDNY